MNPVIFIYSAFVLGVNSVDKYNGWKVVESLRSDKPVLVVGAPKAPPPIGHPYGDVTIDIDPRVIKGCPGGEIADVRDIPYRDKYFSVAFVSHVIEHLPSVNDAERALSELRRVADHVVIVSPHFFDFVNLIHPGHHLIVEPVGICVDSIIYVRPRSPDEAYSQVAI